MVWLLQHNCERINMKGKFNLFGKHRSTFRGSEGPPACVKVSSEVLI